MSSGDANDMSNKWCQASQCTRGRMGREDRKRSRHARWVRERPGVLSSFFNFFPLAACHPIFLAARRPRRREPPGVLPTWAPFAVLGGQTSCDVTPHIRRTEILPRRFHAQSCGTPDTTLSLLLNLSRLRVVSLTAVLKSRRLEECGEGLPGLRLDSESSE